MLSDISVGERSGRVIVREGFGNKVRTMPLNASARLALAVYLAPQRGFCGEKCCDPDLSDITFLLCSDFASVFGFCLSYQTMPPFAYPFLRGSPAVSLLVKLASLRLFQ